MLPCVPGAKPVSQNPGLCAHPDRRGEHDHENESQAVNGRRPKPTSAYIRLGATPPTVPISRAQSADNRDGSRGAARFRHRVASNGQRRSPSRT